MDYNRVAEMAKRLIDSNGRSVTVRRLGRNPANPVKPWRGSETPRISLEIEYEASIRAVIVEPYSLIRYGFTGEDDEEIRRVDVVFIASGKDFMDLSIDPMGMDELVDSGASYNVNLVRQLAPGDVPLLYVIGAKR